MERRRRHDPNASSLSDPRLPSTLKLIAEIARLGIYAASPSMGVTGARAAVTRSAPAPPVQRVCVGLASNGARPVEIGAYADGVIVGSALVTSKFDENVSPWPEGIRASLPPS